MHQHTFMPDFPDHSALSAHQLKGLQWTVRHAFEGSSFYRQRLEKAGSNRMPSTAWTISNDCRLPRPTTCASSTRFPCDRCPSSRLYAYPRQFRHHRKTKNHRIHPEGPGRLGSLFCTLLRNGRRHPLDRVQIAVGYGIWTAGMGFQLGCEKVGAMAVPVGPGNIDMHIQFMEDVRSTVFLQYGLHGPAHGRGDPPARHRRQNQHRKIIYGSERSSRSMRRQDR
jgi:phenylacetate-CoA ligase